MMPDLFVHNGTHLVLVEDDDALGTAQVCCPASSDEACCDDWVLPDEVIVDLGAGGLANDHCADAGDGGCGDISGEFTLAKIDATTYEYTTANWCDNTDILTVIAVFGFELDGCCRWTVSVSLSGVSGDSSLWVSPAIKFNEVDCTLSAAKTLTAVSHQWDWFCSGTLPNTITVEAAP